MDTTKVTMNLTDIDLRNTEKLTKTLNARSKASTVSKALAITKTITDSLEKGGDLVVHNPDGSTTKITIVDLDNGR